jgi:hypothetical protein
MTGPSRTVATRFALALGASLFVAAGLGSGVATPSVSPSANSLPMPLPKALDDAVAACSRAYLRRDFQAVCDWYDPDAAVLGHGRKKAALILARQQRYPEYPFAPKAAYVGAELAEGHDHAVSEMIALNYARLPKGLIGKPLRRWPANPIAFVRVFVNGSKSSTYYQLWRKPPAGWRTTDAPFDVNEGLLSEFDNEPT